MKKYLLTLLLTPALAFSAPCALFQKPAHALTRADFGLKNAAPKLELVSIWGLWCGPCRGELALFNRLAKDKAVTVSLLNLGDNPKAIADFAKGAKLSALSLTTTAPEHILQIVKAPALPYNALFVRGKLFGVANRALEDEAALRACFASFN